MERIIIQHKVDIVDMLHNVRYDLHNIRTTHFALNPVTSADEPKCGIFFDHSKKDWLRTMGVLENLNNYEYGYFRSNLNNSKVNNKLTDVDKLIAEILCYLKDYNLHPKTYRFSDLELSRFEIIDGGGQDSWLVQRLKEGVLQ